MAGWLVTLIETMLVLVLVALGGKLQLIYTRTHTVKHADELMSISGKQMQIDFILLTYNIF